MSDTAPGQITPPLQVKVQDLAHELGCPPGLSSFDYVEYVVRKMIAERDMYVLQNDLRPETEAESDFQVNSRDPAPEWTQKSPAHYGEESIQPVEYIHRNGLDFFEGNVVKYVTRHKHKDGRRDIEKAIHYLQMILHNTYS